MSVSAYMCASVCLPLPMSASANVEEKPATSGQLAILLDESSLVRAAAATGPRCQLCSRCNRITLTSQHGRSCHIGNIDE